MSSKKCIQDIQAQAIKNLKKEKKERNKKITELGKKILAKVLSDEELNNLIKEIKN